MKTIPFPDHPGIDLAELFSEGPVVLIVWRPLSGWPVAHVSQNIAHLLGYSPAELYDPGFRFTDLIHHEDLENVTQAIQSSLAGMFRPCELVYRLRTKSGFYHWVRAYSRPVQAQPGEPGYIQGYLLDHTNIKLVETALAESLNHTQAILENVLDGIITINEEGVVTSFNRAAERIFGYHSREVVGSSIGMLLPESSREEQIRRLLGAPRDDAPQFIGAGRQFQAARKDGGVFPMELPMSAITLEGRKVLIGIVRDLTERDRIEKMKSEFVSTISHELRTPLTSISGAIGLLAGGVLGKFSDQALRMLELAQQNSQRLTLLINDLLDMDKINSGKMHFNMHVHELMPLVEQALTINASFASQFQTSITLAQRVEAVKIRVDKERFLQILSNFLSNAAKFSPSGGEVRLSVSRLGDMVRVAVQDNGPGIAVEFHEHIFQKFTQADSSDTRQKGGTGLGLAIAKALAEKMDAQVGFVSEFGHGATFYVDIPMIGG